HPHRVRNRGQSPGPLGPAARCRAHRRAGLGRGGMMRLGTVLTLGLAGAVGIGLFYSKHRVQALEHELTTLQQQIVGHREAIHVLNAEWSFLNDPDRLAELSRRHLDLAPVSGSQLATIADVPEKLMLASPELPPEEHEDAPVPDTADPGAQIVSAPSAP